MSESPPSTSSSLSSSAMAIEEYKHIDDLPEFAPVTEPISVENHNFYRVVVWTKSAFDYEDLEIPPLVDDLPAMGIHGFNPVYVSAGEGNAIISHKHICRKGPFVEKRFKKNVIKPHLLPDLQIHWPTLKRGNTIQSFLKRQAWKHNTDLATFPDYRDFIEKGLHVGSHYLNLISSWMLDQNFQFDSKTKYSCSDFEKRLSEHLSFIPDTRFYRLPHLEGVCGLKKIGILGVLSNFDEKPKFNPVDFQLDEDNLKSDECNIPRKSVFMLELLRDSIAARALTPKMDKKRDAIEGSSSSVGKKPRKR